jgi:hypothetical protein
MFARFFSTTETDEFADWIVAEVKRAAPPDLASRNDKKKKKKKKHLIRARGMDENIAKRVVEFSQTTRLNIYKRARLAARVREGLTGHGYPKAFVRAFSFELIERIQTAAIVRTD